MFANDADLLTLEPRLFLDIIWAGQVILKAPAAISGGSLVFDGQDPTLEQLGVETGSVVTVGEASFAVAGRSSENEVTIACPRRFAEDPPGLPGKLEDGEVTITTFRPQLGVIHRQLLRMAGIDPLPFAMPGRANESNITNPEALRLAAVLGTLHLIYAAAGALLPEEAPVNQRARTYRDWYAQERRNVIVELDLDGDGKPDAARRLNSLMLGRD